MGSIIQAVQVPRGSLSGPPPGDVLELQDTSQLKPGDQIYIEFPFMSNGRLMYGSSQVFTVFAFDLRPELGINKVGVTDQGGAQAWFEGGTKDQLISKLKEKTSFTTLVIVRPKVAGPTAPPPPTLTASEKELADGAKALGLPSDQAPVKATMYDELFRDDYLFTVDPYNGTKRLWRADDVSDAEKIILTLVKGTKAGESSGNTITVPKYYAIEASNQMVFRTARLEEQPLELREFMQYVGDFDTRPIMVAGFATAGTAAVILGVLLLSK